jgi:hypothetical protein
MALPIFISSNIHRLYAPSNPFAPTTQSKHIDHHFQTPPIPFRFKKGQHSRMLAKNRLFWKKWGITILLLAVFSNYFRNLFFGDWNDKKKAQNYFEIVETEDFDVKAFGLMIYSAMTMGAMVHESNFLMDLDRESKNINGKFGFIKISIYPSKS